MTSSTASTLSPGKLREKNRAPTAATVTDNKRQSGDDWQQQLEKRLFAITNSDLNPLTETWDDPFTAPTSPEVGPTSPPPEKASTR